MLHTFSGVLQLTGWRKNLSRLNENLLKKQIKPQKPGYLFDVTTGALLGVCSGACSSGKATHAGRPGRPNIKSRPSPGGTRAPRRAFPASLKFHQNVISSVGDIVRDRRRDGGMDESRPSVPPRGAAVLPTAN